MDISLISINLNTLELQFAGANNPIYIIKKSEVEESTHEKKERLENEFTLLELKPDKMPIGFHENMAAFTLQTIKLNKHDKIFLFSDGYADQFGGPKGKKFMYKQFKELLIYNSNQNMGEIKSILEQTIKEWMKKIEQVDDITVMGIEV
jgi:serine phosphatase RsbU (regulator of sigma subunit)